MQSQAEMPIPAPMAPVLVLVLLVGVVLTGPQMHQALEAPKRSHPSRGCDRKAFRPRWHIATTVRAGCRPQRPLALLILPGVPKQIHRFQDRGRKVCHPYPHTGPILL